MKRIFQRLDTLELQFSLELRGDYDGEDLLECHSHQSWMKVPLTHKDQTKMLDVSIEVSFSFAFLILTEPNVELEDALKEKV